MENKKSYAKVENEILEGLAKINLSSYQARVIFVVWRKTYGFSKSEDRISNSQIIKETGLDKRHVSRTLKELKARKLVTYTGDKIGFNKSVSEWCDLEAKTQKKLSPIEATLVTYTGDKKSPIQADTITTNNNILKKHSNECLTQNASGAEKNFGNEDILKMIIFLKKEIGIDDFVEAQRWTRIYAKNICRIREKIGEEMFDKRLAAILADDFKRKNCNKIKYLYGEIKGFIQAKSSNINYD